LGTLEVPYHQDTQIAHREHPLLQRTQNTRPPLQGWGWDDKEGDMGATCRPLGVEVYQLADAKVLEGWKPWHLPVDIPPHPTDDKWLPYHLPYHPNPN
jgi:hypothetical protein